MTGDMRAGETRMTRKRREEDIRALKATPTLSPPHTISFYLAAEQVNVFPTPSIFLYYTLGADSYGETGV